MLNGELFMRIARVIGTVTLNHTTSGLRPGQWLIAATLDDQVLKSENFYSQRRSPMPQSLVVFDEMGAAAGQLIAVSEGREAAMPFWPDKVPVDAYCAAILDALSLG